jgi:nucleoside-diphosphate-sugar epimerase
VRDETVLILGCGYRGRKLARRLIAEGYYVRALTRSTENAAALEEIGVEPRIGDITDPITLCGLGDGVTYVYHLMGSMRGDDAELEALHVHGTRSVLALLRNSKIKRFVYESSTAVYGQMDGEWLDESAPREPTSTMGKLRVQAEDLLLNAWREHAFPVLILRPASIYRPEGVINKKIRQGAYTLASDPEKLMNHIYIEDFIEILLAAREKGQAGEAYNVADDLPKRSIDYMNLIAELMRAPKIKVEWEMRTDGCADLIRQSNKKVSNAKLKKDFGLALRYPTYREGLRESARRSWME